MDYPLGVFEIFNKYSHLCLNPYSNGLPSRGYSIQKRRASCRKVLIPILMDYPLGGERMISGGVTVNVLIPILMDYPLGASDTTTVFETWVCLNPYSNGLPSRGTKKLCGTKYYNFVLIPILMDYPLGEEWDTIKLFKAPGLNPYSNGLPSRGGQLFVYNQGETMS